MSSQLPPSPPPAKCRSVAPTTIHDLDEDLLREVFLRLHALPSLVRTALTCRTFLRAVRSSPAFRRCFRALHPSPFLGIFIQPLIKAWEPGVPYFAAHHCRSDQDFAAAVRSGDFSLVALPDCDGNDGEDDDDEDEEDENNDNEEGEEEEEEEEDEEASPVWQIERCFDGGYVLLFNRRAKQIAVYNPLTRSLHLFPSPPHVFTSALFFEFHITSSEEDLGSLRLVCFVAGFIQAHVAVISSDSINLQVFPEPGILGATGKAVNGPVYWTHTGKPFMTVLNTTTLEFSKMDLPPLLAVQGRQDRECAFVLGNTKDGNPCIVSPDLWGDTSLEFYVWRPDEYDDGVERWILDQTFELNTIRQLTECPKDSFVIVRVVDVIDGIVYLRTEYDGDTEAPQLLLSFCLEKAELKKICEDYHKPIHPYIMGWPPSLVHDKGSSSKDEVLSTPSSEGSDVKAGGGPAEPASVAKA